VAGPPARPVGTDGPVSAQLRPTWIRSNRIGDAGGTSGGFNVLTPGTRTMQVLGASGNVLASGSYTVNP
jgi:hypothetical protein